MCFLEIPTKHFKKKRKGSRISPTPLPVDLLEAEVHVFPGILPLFAEAVVARFQLDNLQLILLSCNLMRAQFTHFGAECHEGLVSSISWVCEDAGLEDFTSVFVGECTNLHLAVALSKGDERPRVDDSLIVSSLCHSS